jgi:hypothetical protein
MRRVIKLMGVALAAATLLGTDIATGQAASQPAATGQAAPSPAAAPASAPAAGDQAAPAATEQRPLIQVRRPPRLSVPNTEVMTNEPGAGASLPEDNRTPLLPLGDVRVSGGPVVISFPDTRTSPGTQEIAVPSLVFRMPWTVP